MTSHRSPDASVAKLLAAVPAFRNWTYRPLDRDLRRRLAQVDHHTLKTVVAHCLGMILGESSEDDRST